MKTGLSFVIMLACGLALHGQNVISTHSGLIHFVDGYGATIDGLLVAPKLGEFPLMKDGETLSSENARVEVLLNPGVFLRLDMHSALKMVSNKLSDTRVEMLAGSAVVELDELQNGNNFMLLFQGAKITPTKRGLYRLDATQRRFRVFEGEAQVIQEDQTIALKGGRQVELGAVLAVSKFNRKLGDGFDSWAANRSEVIAMANITSAKMMSTGGTSYKSSSWVWNPYYAVFTYLPYRGYGYNPYGWRIYSPGTVENYYHPHYSDPGPSVYAASNAGGDSRGSLTNNSAVVSSNPSVAAAPAPAVSAAPGSMSRGSISSGGGQGR